MTTTFASAISSAASATTKTAADFPVWKTIHIASGDDLDLVLMRVEQLGLAERLPKPEDIAESARKLGLEFVPFMAVVKLVSVLGKEEDKPNLGFLHLFANKWGEAYSVSRRSKYQEEKNPDLIKFLVYEGIWCTGNVAPMRFCMTPNDQVVFVKPRPPA